MRVTYNQLTELTGKTYRTIKKSLSENGINPAEQVGNKILFDSIPALEALFRPGGNGDDLDLTHQRALLTAEQLREKKRENDIADDLLVPIQILTDALQKVGLQMVALLESLPLEMKRANPRLTGHDIMQVKRSIHRCCDAISRIQLKDE